MKQGWLERAIQQECRDLAVVIETDPFARPAVYRERVDYIAGKYDISPLSVQGVLGVEQMRYCRLLDREDWE